MNRGHKSTIDAKWDESYDRNKESLEMKYARYTPKQLQLVENGMGELGEVERVLMRDSLTGAGAFAGLLTVMAVRQLHRCR